MFDRNKTGDYVTRDQADEYVRDLKRQAGNSFVSREDAASFQRMVSALEERVQELENLAAQVRGTGAVAPAGAARVAGRVPTTSVALTRGEAQQALAQLKREGVAQFDALSRKIDTAVSQFVNRNQSADERDETSAPVQGGTTGVDYGAVAYGLSQIKRDVTNLVGSEVRGTDLAEHYRQSVQYFVDVFAKSDPSFDADAFKQQAGA